jgi:hypothetical protein
LEIAMVAGNPALARKLISQWGNASLGIPKVMDVNDMVGKKCRVWSEKDKAYVEGVIRSVSRRPSSRGTSFTCSVLYENQGCVKKNEKVVEWEALPGIWQSVVHLEDEDDDDDGQDENDVAAGGGGGGAAGGSGVGAGEEEEEEMVVAAAGEESMMAEEPPSSSTMTPVDDDISPTPSKSVSTEFAGSAAAADDDMPASSPAAASESGSHHSISGSSSATTSSGDTQYHDCIDLTQESSFETVMSASTPMSSSSSSARKTPRSGTGGSGLVDLTVSSSTTIRIGTMDLHAKKPRVDGKSKGSGTQDIVDLTLDDD